MPQSAPATDTRKAFRELLDLLHEADERFLGAEWAIEAPGDVADGHRLLMHLLESGLYAHFESDPERPVFRRIVSPTRKFTGDNPDAIYFEAPIRADRRYRIRGNLAGAVYTSITLEAGAEEGRYSTRTAGAINDTELDAGPDGSFEVLLGGERRPRGWLPLPPDAARVTTRHYFEEERPAAADPGRWIPLAIEPLDPPPPPPSPDDASIAAGIRRVANHLRGKTLEQPPPGQRAQPSWVSLVPNRFNPPETPGDLAFAAVDAAYTMAPYVLGPDQALLLSGRFPRCRFANVVLWNRFLQSYDYAHRTISRNRAQTRLEPDGSYRIVVAHREPGLPNWIDTEGRASGLVYWRFLLPEGPVETPEARVVPFAEVA